MKCEEKRMPKILSGISIILMIAICAMFLLNLVSSIVVMSTSNIVVNGFEIAAIIVSNVLMPLELFTMFMFYLNIDDVEDIGKRRYFASTEKHGEKTVDRALKVSLSASFVFVMQALIVYFLRKQYRYPDVFIGKVILRNVALGMLIIAALLVIAALIYFPIAYRKFYHKENEKITNWSFFLIDVDYVAEKFAESFDFDEKEIERNRKAIMQSVRLIADYKKYQEDDAMIEVYVMNKALNYCREKKWVYEEEQWFAPLFICKFLSQKTCK